MRPIHRAILALIFSACNASSAPAGGCDGGTCDGGPPPPPPPPPSCVGLAAGCGALRTDDCCASPAVPGGMFFRGYDAASDHPDYADQGSTRRWPATVSDFRLDKYQVTVGRFRKFLAAVTAPGQPWRPVDGAGANPTVTGSGWNYDHTGWFVDWNGLEANVHCDKTYQTWTDQPGANEAHPMNCVTWFEAFAFCAWDGGFLATEAEWSYAASGGGEQRAFPWSQPPGSTMIDCAHANYYGALGETAECYPQTLTTDVGTLSPLGDGKWGQADLAGNLFQWLLDWESDGPRPPHYAIVPCNDCAFLQPTTDRVARGGHFAAPSFYLRAAFRWGWEPTLRNYGIGIRCARAK